jgi:hypothetical protein
VTSTAPRNSTRGEPLLASSPDAAFWDDLRDAKGEVSLRGARLQKWLALQATGSAQSLAATADSTVLTQSVLGQGKVSVCGLAWDHRWSNLPRRSVFLPFALAFARVHDITAGSRLDLLAGETVPLAPAAPATLTLKSMAGDSLSWNGRSAALSAPARAGIYRVEGLTPPLTVAVSGDPSEDSVRVADSERSLLVGVPHRVLPYRDAAGLLGEIHAARRGASLFGACLVLAALVWALELALACKPV